MAIAPKIFGFEKKKNFAITSETISFIWRHFEGFKPIMGLALNDTRKTAP